jgi:hypothetical protein
MLVENNDVLILACLALRRAEDCKLRVAIAARCCVLVCNSIMFHFFFDLTLCHCLPTQGAKDSPLLSLQVRQCSPGRLRTNDTSEIFVCFILPSISSVTLYARAGCHIWMLGQLIFVMNLSST